MRPVKTAWVFIRDSSWKLVRVIVHPYSSDCWLLTFIFFHKEKEAKRKVVIIIIFYRIINANLKVRVGHLTGVGLTALNPTHVPTVNGPPTRKNLLKSFNEYCN
jgi:hypothetical protein